MAGEIAVQGTNSAAPFSLNVHRGDGMCLLGMDWTDGLPPDDMVGFTIEYLPPGNITFLALRNRLISFDPTTNPDSIPRVQALQGEIAALDGQIPTVRDHITSLKDTVADLTARLDRVRPGPGAASTARSVPSAISSGRCPPRSTPTGERILARSSSVKPRARSSSMYGPTWRRLPMTPTNRAGECSTFANCSATPGAWTPTATSPTAPSLSS